MASKGETELERRVRLLAQAREAFLKAKATEAKASRHHEPLADAKKKKNRDKKRKRAAADHASEPAPPPALASRQASRPRAHEASSSISSRRSGSSGGGSGVVVLQGVSEHPFEADLGDHCETPLKAYVDVAPLLRGLARDLGVAAKDLRIYDPYYCEGGMRAHLAALGFHTVINRNVDFYREPLATDAFDVLVTNPPYSANHVPRILSFCAELSASAHKPWLLLVPAYVHDKPYYSALISPAQGVGYVWPWLRCVLEGVAFSRSVEILSLCCSRCTHPLLLSFLTTSENPVLKILRSHPRIPNAPSALALVLAKDTRTRARRASGAGPWRWRPSRASGTCSSTEPPCATGPQAGAPSAAVTTMRSVAAAWATRAASQRLRAGSSRHSRCSRRASGAPPSATRLPARRGDRTPRRGSALRRASATCAAWNSETPGGDGSTPPVTAAARERRGRGAAGPGASSLNLKAT